MQKLIYYPPGCYGTFINWICTSDGPVTKTDLPFGEFGNSHKYYDANPGLLGAKYRDLCLSSNRDLGVLRVCWPMNVGIKLSNVDHEPDFFYRQCYNDLSQVLLRCNQVVVIHPTEHSRIWWYQNYSEKTIIPKSVLDRFHNIYLANDDFSWLALSDPVLRARHHLDLQKHHTGFEEFFKTFDKSTALEFEIYQLRQILAWELHRQTSDYYQCWKKIAQGFPQFKFVSLEQLRDQFKPTMHDIFEYFALHSKVVESFDLIENEWSMRQQHQFKDSVIDTIVTAIMTQQTLNWQHHNLNLFDEIYMEKILHYEHGIQLLPANTWPTNSRDFSRIIK